MTEEQAWRIAITGAFVAIYPALIASIKGWVQSRYGDCPRCRESATYALCKAWGEIWAARKRSRG